MSSNENNQQITIELDIPCMSEKEIFAAKLIEVAVEKFKNRFNNEPRHIKSSTTEFLGVNEFTLGHWLQMVKECSERDIYVKPQNDTENHIGGSKVLNDLRKQFREREIGFNK